MDNERVREFCLSLPHVSESVNWGHHLVFWVGDKAIGGTGVLWFHCGAERYQELLETEGIIPAPYMAKAYWVTIERWGVLRQREFEDELRKAHTLIYEKLPKRTKAVLSMPDKERYTIIRERRKILAGRAKEK
jgi:predicted DNA-binding protein (MmcQ/YjbR family)